MRTSLKIKSLACLALAVFVTPGFAQSPAPAGEPGPITAAESRPENKPPTLWDKFPKPENVPEWDQPRAQSPFDFGWIKINGYAVAHYSNFDWQTFKDKRDEADIERFILGFDLLFTEWLELDVEVEFEHGGTGSALEFERFEEFGEFEFEAEHGGEIVLEELEIELFIDPAFNLNFGHLEVPVGYTNLYHRPGDYYTNTRPEAETNIIPTVWHNNAIQIYGNLTRYFRYDLMVVAGLDSSRFSSERFAADGSQSPFEGSLAHEFGVAWRLSTKPLGGVEVSASGFIGNTANNRPRDDMTSDAYLYILNVFAYYDRRPITARASVLYGNLQNSEKVTLANKNLSNNLQVPRTPVAREALGVFAEVGFDFLWLMPSKPAAQSLDLFLRYDWYDTMLNTVGTVQDQDRYLRQGVTTGLNGRPYPNLILKATFQWRWLGIEDHNDELTYTLGFGVEF
ncbi:MAG: hypothetical protein IT462_06230 [Planctomycetes bacterium]|nr:hypothetical protein [Planctomycetota bacterium]